MDIRNRHQFGRLTGFRKVLHEREVLYDEAERVFKVLSRYGASNETHHFHYAKSASFNLPKESLPTQCSDKHCPEEPGPAAEEEPKVSNGYKSKSNRGCHLKPDNRPIDVRAGFLALTLVNKRASVDSSTVQRKLTLRDIESSHHVADVW